MGRNRLFLGPIVINPPNVPKHAVQSTFREGYAQLPQSTTADKINEQGIEFIYYDQGTFRPVELLTQIHDSIVFQISKSVPLDEHARIIILVKKSLEQSLYWHEREIPTPADLSIGWNMCKEDMKEIKSKDIPHDKYQLAEKLQEINNELSRQSNKQSCGIL
jgi:hypothetical protein